MKIYFLLSCMLILCANAAYAQDKLPAFGKIDKADLEMKTCDFDPDGEALYLFDIGEVQLLESIGSFNMQTDRRVRIKILKEKGISAANIKFSYYSRDKYEDISDLSGMVYNLDDAGNIITTKLDKSLIFDKKVNNNYSEISFAFPNVKVGTVIEYKYRSYKKNGIVNIDNWIFQKDVPVKYSAYNLFLPAVFDYTYQITRRQPVETTKPKRDEDGIWYIMKEIPALKEEPYMAGLNDYYQRIDFQLAGYNPIGGRPQSFRNTWPKLSEELLSKEYFGGQFKKNLSQVTDLEKMLLQTKDPKQKVAIVYKYVQKNMDWNGRNSIGAFDGIKTAWDKKSGSSGEINLILLNLLKDAGIKALPCLVSTRDNGTVNTTYPLLDQFNAVYIYVNVDSNTYLLNAADKYNPPTLIPYDVQLTEGYIVDEKQGGFIYINDNAKKLKHNIAIQLTVDSNGKINGQSIINSYEYAKNIRVAAHKKGTLKGLLANSATPNINIDSIAVNNIENDSLPLEQNIHFSGQIQASGEYAFLPYNMFTNLDKNPFVAERRQTNIDFGFNQQYVIIGSFNIAENYEFEDLPKNISMIMEDTSISFTRLMQKDATTLNFNIKIFFKKPRYSAEDYPDVKTYYKQLFAKLNEQIVIKKKTP